MHYLIYSGWIKVQDFISSCDTYDPTTDFPNKAKGP